MARESLRLDRRIANSLGPTYANCGPHPSADTCTRREADPYNGCPKCEYQIQRGHFKRDVEEQYKRASPGHWADEKWPFELMEEVVNVAASAYYDYPKRPNRKWTATMAHSVAVYRSELNKLKQADNWRMLQSLRKQQQGRADSEDGSYDED